jgi:hypothetical protein
MRASGWLAKAATASALAILTLSGGAPAQSTDDVDAPSAAAAIRTGDIAVTGFSGTKLATDKLPPGVDPVDRTFVDPNGPALRIFDVSSLGGAPSGKLVDAPLRLDVPASQIGQVFGLAFDAGTTDAPPNLYVAATSAFGLNIVGAGRAADGKPVRLQAGAPDAVFMEGQFGSLGSNSPSAIYKIDGATGAPNYFADTAFAGGSNAGPGIGGLAFDPLSRSLYASDLDTGVIHRFALDYNAADLSQFDHGVAGRRTKGLESIADDGRRLQITDPSFKPDDPATWGITQPERRVDAMAVRDDRLYYSVADGPEIWSVGLRGGDFGDDARLELKVSARNPYPVTSIAFDGNGRMLLAQRGPVLSPYDYSSFASAGGEVLRYAPKPANEAQPDERWEPEPATYAVGTADDGRGSDGGLSLQYAYNPDGTLDTGVCDASVVMSGDALTTKNNGVQINGIDLVRPANVPPTQSTFVDYDESDDDPALRGHVGNVATLRKCGADSAFPPVAEGMPPVVDGGAFPPVDGGGSGTFPPVEDGDGGTTFPDVVDDGTTTDPEGGDETVEVDGVSITKSAVPGTCTEQGGCTFNIDVVNNSGKDLPEIVIGDELTAGAANLGGAKIEGAAPEPWTCTAPPKFTCTHKGPVKNGEAVSLPLSFVPEGIGQETELKNCATLGAAPQTPDPKPPVVLPEPTSSEEKGMKFEQNALTQPCTAGQACEWEVKVTNNNAEPRTGNFVWFTEFAFIKDAATARALGVTVESVTSANPQAVCVPIANDISKMMRCTAENVTLAPGESFTAKVKVKADAPADAPTAALQSTIFTDFTDSQQEQATGKATAAAELVPPGEDGQQEDGDDAGATPSAPVCATLPVEQPEEPTASEAGQISLLKTGVSCKNKKSCEFNFAIKNSSANDFDGEVVFDDSLTADGGIFGGTTINPAPPAPWSCSLNAQQGFKCTAKLKIPANSAAPPLNLTFELPDGLGVVQTVENCAMLKDAAEQTCATLPLDAPAPPPGDQQGGGPDAEVEKPFPNLSIEKRNASPDKGGADHCDLKKECLFIIRVTNTGTSDFAGPIKVTDTISLGVPELIKEGPGGNLGWKCSTAQNGKGGIAVNTSIECEIAGAPNPLKPGTFVPLAPGKFIELGISVKPGGTWQNSNQIENCAELAAGDGQDIGPAEKRSCVSQKLDPFDVEITKTGDQSCKPGGECRFELDIFNPGPILHDDPVTVVDKLTGLSSAEIVSITPSAGADPFPCTPAPTKVPFNCSGHMKLEIGEHNKYVMIVRLPAEASAASFSNCASVKKARSDDDGAQSCHSVQTKPPAEPATCKGGMILLPEGECACPAGATWNGRNCSRGASSVDECPADRPNGVSPHCCPADTHFDRSVNPPRGACVRDGGGKGTTTPPPVCEGRRPVGKFPNCCPVDMHFERSAGPRGGCVRDGGGKDTTTPPPVCEGKRPVGKFPNCCPVDMHFDRSVGRRGACVSDGGKGTTTPPPVCEGKRPVGKFPNCCPVGMHFERSAGPRGGCVRDGGKGTDDGGDGKCAAGTIGKPPNCKCPLGWLGKPPKCCPPGSRFKDGNCVRPTPTGKCTGGRVGTPPNCKCPPGTRLTRSEQCVADPSPTPSKTETSKDKCTRGRIGSPPNCFCPPRTKFIGGRCRPAETPKPTPTGPSPQKQCSGGKVPRSGDGACVCPSGTTDRGGQCVGSVR